MTKFCTKCGRELKDGKCVICKQKAVSTSYLVIGIVLVSVAFILGIILGAVVPTTTEVVKSIFESETKSSFNWQIMLTTWGIGAITFIFYLATYHLFRKIDYILIELKNK